MHKKSPQLPERLCLLAVRTRLELATPCVTGMYSNQLNYRTIFLKELPFIERTAKVKLSTFGANDFLCGGEKIEKMFLRCITPDFEQSYWCNLGNQY